MSIAPAYFCNSVRLPLILDPHDLARRRSGAGLLAGPRGSAALRVVPNGCAQHPPRGRAAEPPAHAARAAPPADVPPHRCARSPRSPRRTAGRTLSRARVRRPGHHAERVVWRVPPRDVAPRAGPGSVERGHRRGPARPGLRGVAGGAGPRVEIDVATRGGARGALADPPRFPHPAAGLLPVVRPAALPPRRP